MKDNIREWLRSGKVEFTVKEGRTTTHYLRLHRTEDLDLILWQNNYNSEHLQLNGFIYAGLYNRATGMVYDSQFGDFCDDYSYNRSKILKTFEAEIKAKINSIIGNDRSNLSIKSASQITDYGIKQNLKYVLEYGKHDEVRRLYLAGRTPEDIVYNADYSLSRFPDDDYVSYLLDKEKMIESYAKKWIADNQERIFFEFLVNDAIKAELEKIIDDPDDGIHTVKAIIDAFKNTNCKTVNVTTVIGGKELTFKTDADEFRRDCIAGYSPFYIAAKDRREFAAVYGKHAHYTPDDITKITYGKTVLYDRVLCRPEEAFASDPEEAPGMTMSM